MINWVNMLTWRTASVFDEGKGEILFREYVID